MKNQEMRKEISSPSLIQSLEKSEVYYHGQKRAFGYGSSGLISMLKISNLRKNRKISGGE